MSTPQARAQRIEAQLRQALDASHVEVVDESALHVGHAGAASGAGHFRVCVVSAQFEGKPRVAAQRLVYRALADMMESEIHALSIRALRPDEWESPD